MGINLNINCRDKRVDDILTTLKQLGEQMAGVKEVIEAVRAEQSLIAGALQTIKSLVTEAKQLLEQGNLEGLDELLTEVEANSEALVAATIEGSEAAALLDANNGDPVAAAE